jgi:hypothetical protein
MAKFASSATRNASRLHNFWCCLHCYSSELPHITSVDILIFKFRSVRVYADRHIGQTTTYRRGTRKVNACEHTVYLRTLLAFALLHHATLVQSRHLIAVEFDYFEKV